MTNKLLLPEVCWDKPACQERAALKASRAQLAVVQKHMLETLDAAAGPFLEHSNKKSFGSNL
eukprot:3807079-Amphidinium_carterae.1